jgi:hypothetical protein
VVRCQDRQLETVAKGHPAQADTIEHHSETSVNACMYVPFSEPTSKKRIFILFVIPFDVKLIKKRIRTLRECLQSGQFLKIRG